MIKRSTWILLACLVLVLGVYLVLKYRPASSATTATPTATASSLLLDVSKDKIQSIRVTGKQNQTTLVERGADGLWKVTLPAAGTADQASAEALETQVGALNIVTRLQTAPELSAMGLDAPAETIRLAFVSGAVHTLQVGNLTPTGSGYYVRYDDSTICVISQYDLDPLIHILQNPPYPATATPTDTLEPSATPTLPTSTPTVETTTSPTGPAGTP